MMSRVEMLEYTLDSDPTGEIHLHHKTCNDFTFATTRVTNLASAYVLAEFHHNMYHVPKSEEKK